MVGCINGWLSLWTWKICDVVTTFTHLWFSSVNITENSTHMGCVPLPTCFNVRQESQPCLQCYLLLIKRRAWRLTYPFVTLDIIHKWAYVYGNMPILRMWGCVYHRRAYQWLWLCHLTHCSGISYIPQAHVFCHVLPYFRGIIHQYSTHFSQQTIKA